MGVLLEERSNDLELLIEISCLKTKRMGLFESFHNQVLALSYQAIDIEIDYHRKRIYMNVLANEKKNDNITKWNQEIPYLMSTNIYFTDLSYFLKLAIKNDLYLLNHFDDLKQNFMNCHAMSHDNGKVNENIG